MEQFNQSDLSDNDDAESVHSEGHQTPTIPVAPAKTVRRNYRYSNEDDVAILKEVIACEATREGSADKWRKIFDNLSLPVKDYKAIKTRFDVLMTAFKKDERSSVLGSGLDEDYDEKRQLLTEIANKMEDWGKAATRSQNSDKKKKEDSQAQAKIIREESLKGLSGSDTPETTPTSSRPKKRKLTTSDFLDLVQTTENAESEHKMMMLNLETKKFEMMERDISLREENDKHRREMDRRAMDLEEKRLEQETRRMELDHEKNMKEREVHASLMKLLSNMKKD